jgi:excisionase family DNA binding protein
MKLYDIKTVALMLAVSPWTVRAYIRNGKLRPVRIGRLVRVDEQDLDGFVARAKNYSSDAVGNQTKEKEDAK